MIASHCCRHGHRAVVSKGPSKEPQWGGHTVGPSRNHCVKGLQAAVGTAVESQWGVTVGAAVGTAVEGAAVGARVLHTVVFSVVFTRVAVSHGMQLGTWQSAKGTKIAARGDSRGVPAPSSV